MINIDIKKIDSHPDNPRKDLGDLTELSDSIKESGILQNLTVVPWFSSITYAPADNDKMDDRYICVIGHRRLAAAKKAGLTSVPCVVANMDLKTQVATMLLENMQRSDLTIYEQAQGIQMMMNLGESVSDIAKKTGFGKSTLYKRVKLLELEEKAFKGAVDKGATLDELAEINKIENVEVKGKVLDSYGTSNFGYELRNAILREQSARDMVKLEEIISTFATKVEDMEGLSVVSWLYPSNWETYKKPEDADTEKYFYKVDGNYIRLLKEKIISPSNQENSYDEERKEKQRRKGELDRLVNTSFEVRREFIKNYTKAKAHLKDIAEFMAMVLIDNSCEIDEELFSYMGVVELEDGELPKDDIRVLCQSSPEKMLLLIAYCSLDGNYRKHYNSWDVKYSENRGLSTLYQFLQKLGYEESDVERQLNDGTHELYVKD